MKKIVVALSLLVLTACAPPEVQLRNAESVVPVNVGYGVYYFPVANMDFAKSLADFLKDHPCTIEGITGDGGGSYGADRGYFIVCR